jgi:8-oxo-dGTP pyrophosphatase MutT (NUDIX family)
VHSAPLSPVDRVHAVLARPRAEQKSWLVERLRSVPSVRGSPVLRVSDGFRLPGREGEPRPAAVLVPVVNRDEGLQILLTQRSPDLSDHAGQICFPGGRYDECDGTLAACALRESREEIGLDPRRVEVLGELPTYETVTGFRVTPVVAWVEPPFELTPDPVEVADVFEVPLAFVLDPANHQRHFRIVGPQRRDYYAIPYGDRFIWGATAAMILILHHALTAEQE